MAKILSLSRVVEPSELAAFFPEILSLSKKEANPLGFIPSGGMKTAIANRRLLALVDDETGSLAGYIFFGGVFPSAKVFQIAVATDYRRAGVGSSLLELLASHLEQFSYRSLIADIRDDLVGALAFYRSNGFTQVSSRKGGETRGRTILTHVKELDTEDLFSVYEERDFLSSQIHHLASRGDAKFSLDLNVYFDIAKRREYASQAEELFRAALAGTLRIAVADEFVSELRKTAKSNQSDPVLNMALCLPKLPRVGKAEHEALSEKLHDLVFAHKQEPTRQSRSDCAHLAHAALARSTAFVTRDVALLTASHLVQKEIGLEIVSPQELFALLPSELDGLTEEQFGEGFRTQSPSAASAKRFLADLGGSGGLYAPIERQLLLENSIIRAVEANKRIEAIGVVSTPKILGARTDMALACRPESPDRRLYVDHLLDALLRDASQSHPTAIRLLKIPGQSVVNEVARARGFIQPNSGSFEKSVIGKPIHPLNWDKTADDLKIRTGIALPIPSPLEREDTISIEANGRAREFGLESLEELLGPTLIWWSARPAVVVPIEKQYSVELLGVCANKAFEFIENREASFRSLRAYVSSPRNALRMVAGSLIFFYESQKRGGCGAIVAAGKIVSASVERKHSIEQNELGHIVVDDVSKFSKSEEVLLTKFDCLFQLETFVKFETLREIGAADASNLVTARVIDSCQSRYILEKGFAK